MRIISVPVQFRTVAAALANGLDAAVTVADELPASIRRMPIVAKGFVCLFDPRHVQMRKAPTLEEYFSKEHVIVSYNGDLRGVVEDVLQRPRRIRCSVSSFANIGGIVDGSPLVATVPQIVADQILGLRKHLKTRPIPFKMPWVATELLWPATSDDDEPARFIRDKLVAIAGATKISA